MTSFKSSKVGEKNVPAWANLRIDLRTTTFESDSSSCTAHRHVVDPTRRRYHLDSANSFHQPMSPIIIISLFIDTAIASNGLHTVGANSTRYSKNYYQSDNRSNTFTHTPTYATIYRNVNIVVNHSSCQMAISPDAVHSSIVRHGLEIDHELMTPKGPTFYRSIYPLTLTCEVKGELRSI